MTVRYPGTRKPLVRYRQPFTDASDTRLCLHCLKVGWAASVVWCASMHVRT